MGRGGRGGGELVASCLVASRTYDLTMEYLVGIEVVGRRSCGRRGAGVG